MKKYFYSMLMLAMSAFAFTACEDVPEPYEIPGGNGNQGGTELPEGTYMSEAFTKDFGTFTVQTINGTPWVLDSYGYAKGTGYADGSTTASKSYLVSQPIDLSASKEAKVVFDYVLRYADRTGIENKVLITDNYSGDPETTTWTDITGTLTNVNEWSDWQEFAANVPAAMVGKNTVVLAFLYSCGSSSATWEVKNVAIKEGKVEETAKPEEPETPDTPDTPATGDNLIVNGDFEGWTDGLPNHWKSASSASSATLKQSTIAHSGTYSVQVVGTTSNKRLAYKEIGLKAGDYSMTFYVKAVDKNASVRPGYAIVVDGKISGGDSYKYGDYVNDITSTDWVQVTHNFTIDTDGTFCLVVMNPKNTASDVLIDDFVLTTSNGGVIEGNGNTNPDTPNTGSNTYTLVNSFTEGTYIIAANTEGTSYVVAKNIAADKKYGYLYTTDATLANNTISANEDNEFIFKATTGGYTMQDASGRYYYMTGTYNSWNLSDTMPESGHVWTVSFNDNGTANIVNTEMNKTVQYSSQYTSFGAYPDVTNTLPYLFKK